jgi:hypothetical protein
MAIQLVREEIEIPVVVDEAAIDATVVLVADPVERLRVGHRQRFQQHRMDQREDGGIRPDPQRNRQYDSYGKAG